MCVLVLCIGQAYQTEMREAGSSLSQTDSRTATILMVEVRPKPEYDQRKEAKHKGLGHYQGNTTAIQTATSSRLESNECTNAAVVFSNLSADVCPAIVPLTWTHLPTGGCACGPVPL